MFAMNGLYGLFTEPPVPRNMGGYCVTGAQDTFRMYQSPWEK